jgi:RNase P subunit RPR2
MVRVASMSMQTTPKPSASRHRHKAVTLHVLAQRRGIPYELERKVCSDCSRVLDERPLKRAAA